MKITFRISLIFILLLMLSSKRDSFIFAQEAATEGQEDTNEAPQEEASAGAQAAGEEQQDDALAEEAASATTTTPVLEIKRLETEEPLYSLELRDVDITDLFRVLAHDYKLNLMVDKDVTGTVTASLTSVSLEEALDTIAESQNLILKKKGNIIKIVPNLITKTFTLKYVEAKSMLKSSDSSSASEAASTDTETTGTSSSTSSQANTIYDLLSSKGKVFLGKQPNSIIVIDYPPNIDKVEEYFKIVDQRMASRVFKLKYLKATDVVGAAASSTTDSSSTGTTETTTTETSTTGS